jgi:hypothetical protein
MQLENDIDQKKGNTIAYLISIGIIIAIIIYNLMT